MQIAQKLQREFPSKLSLYNFILFSRRQLSTRRVRRSDLSARAKHRFTSSIHRQRQVPIKLQLPENSSNEMVGIPRCGSVVVRAGTWKKRARKGREGRITEGKRERGKKLQTAANARARPKRMPDLVVSRVLHDNLCKRQFVSERTEEAQAALLLLLLLLHGIHDTAGYAL